MCPFDPMKSKQNYNQPAAGKTRLVFDVPDELALRLEHVAELHAYKSRGALYAWMLRFALGHFEAIERRNL